MPMDGHHAAQALAMEAAHRLLDQWKVGAQVQAEGPRIGFEEGRDSKGKAGATSTPVFSLAASASA